MAETRKLQKLGGSKALTLPSGWLQMIEHGYGHEITEVEIQDNGASLTLKPLFNHGFDGLKYESYEDASNGPHQVARPQANELIHAGKSCSKRSRVLTVNSSRTA